MDNEQKQNKQDDKANQSRRDFLRKSKYAAYAVPLMTSLVINQNAAAASGTPTTDPGTSPGSGSGSDGSTGFS